MDLLDVLSLAFGALALMIAAGSLGTSAVGTLLSNRRSTEALEESRKAYMVALWSGIQEAVQALLGFDPTVEPIKDRLQRFRVAAIALVDELDTWEQLGDWLEKERVVGSLLARELMDSHDSKHTIDQHLDLLEPLMTWATVLSQNLRLFRKVGYDENAMGQLLSAAEDRVQGLCAKHGWKVPATTLPGVTPIA